MVDARRRCARGLFCGVGSPSRFRSRDRPDAARRGCRHRADATALHDEIDSATDAVSIKPFPIAKQSLAATQAALTLSARVPHDQITRVSVHVPPAYAQMISRHRSPRAA